MTSINAGLIKRAKRAALFVMVIFKTFHNMKTKNFKQTCKMPSSGSFFNYLMANNCTIPVVGEYATELLYSDRYCWLIVEVSKDGKRVKLQRCEAVADTTKDIRMGHQNWILQPVNYFTEIVWRYGSWKRIIIDEDFNTKTYERFKCLFGEPKYYYDWSF